MPYILGNYSARLEREYISNNVSSRCSREEISVNVVSSSILVVINRLGMMSDSFRFINHCVQWQGHSSMGTDSAQTVTTDHLDIAEYMGSTSQTLWFLITFFVKRRSFLALSAQYSSSDPFCSGQKPR